MEKEDNTVTCLARWPTKKAVFVLLTVFGMAVTLIYIHLSGQLIGQHASQQVYVGDRPAKSRLRLANKLIHGQSSQRRRNSWQTSADVQKNVMPQSAAVLHDIMRTTVKEKKPPNPTKTKKPSLPRNVYHWNDADPNDYKHLPSRHKDDRKWKHEEALIFNRVGKCGSRTVLDLIFKLANLNNFNFVSSIVYNATLLSHPQQLHIAQVLDHIKTPYLFERHLYFLDFAEFNLKRPMYINIIRDPLDRFVSSYYYNRFGDGRTRQNYKHSDKRKYRSITDCILQRHVECVEKGRMFIIPSFCGQNESCRTPSQWALDRAKQNVEKHFMVVGILEDLENTFRLFEKLLPRFFKGVVKLYLEPDKEQLQKINHFSTKTKYKQMPSPEAAALMTSLLNYEYEFYYFVKDRLEALKKQHGIG